MKSIFVSDLTANDVVTAHFLVLNKEIRQKKTGEPYLSLHLADKTGEIEAKMWDNVAEVMATFDRDDFVKVKGLMQVYQKRAQFTVHKLRRLSDDEVEFADFFPCADRDVDDMWSELTRTIDGIGNVHLKELLQAVFRNEDTARKFRIAPAAKSIHHACRGGLLQHVLSLCSLARLTASHYTHVDLDLLLTGAILHDIGKIEELTYARSFNYSSEGQLLGHIVIGLRLISEALYGLPNFPARLRTLVEHMIISHHGELEFGSPKVPVFTEALLLHHIDNLDSKMEAMRVAALRDDNESEFTGWIPSLERVVLRKGRYLEGPTLFDQPSFDKPSFDPTAVSEEITPQAAHHESGDDGRDGSPVVTVEGHEDSVASSPEKVEIRPDARQERPVTRQERPPARPTTPTLFGEKLQAVLSRNE